ncbi:hypothetical protein KXD93_04720 [Mucilaginibacter sp. BJC16-A38]|uniref:MauE/DoxX family redox-associated membrane protein n=1 Tax=Mucilaginibacter phenanthrenivorans TaxID=1234842 RepID=UPI0021586B20|nr:MauE/DoxX family redox-associated membrane protein [Mucilaginibacter phenanthrenivorans]MCR8556929.1 hypothetical protein [Mucilaginibacter phenanthrenivorans]
MIIEFQKRIFIDVVTVLFVMLFIYAASSKLWDYQTFVIQLQKSPILTTIATWVAWLVPTIEFGIAVLLISERTQLRALYAAFTIMVAFSAYIIAVLNFSENIPCSCGGILQNMNWQQHLIFNLIFVTLGGIAIQLYPNKHRDIIAR